MKGRAIIPLAVGLALGVVAIKYFVNVVKRAQGASTEVVEVVCANSDIGATAEIKESMLEVKTLPKTLAPKMGISDRAEVVGRVAGQQIVSGMPIVPSLLAPKGTPPGLNGLIQAGHRAFTVQVDEFAGVAGWIKPGSRVDVVAVLSGRSGSGNETISKVILQNVEVLAVGQDIGTKADATAAVPKSVTLSVVLADVAKLHLAATKGKIRLAMRNQIESETDNKLAQTTDNELLGDGQPAPSGSKGSLWAGLFSKLPKPQQNATDKEPRARKPEPAPQPVAVAPEVPPARSYDRVQVYAGTQFKEELSFSREDNGWRLVASKNQKDLEAEQGRTQQQVQKAAPAPQSQGRPSLFSRQLD